VKWYSGPLGLAVFAVACAVYTQTAGYSFTYDDVKIVQERELFHNIGAFREILHTRWWSNGLYRPLTALTMAANWTASGGNPHAFHVINLLLHGAASVAVYALGCALLGVGGGLVAGLLFAVHPVHVEAVANIVGRAELLAALFAVLAALLYRIDGQLADRNDRASWRRGLVTVGTLLCTLFAMASKESAFAVPGLLLLVDWFDAWSTSRRFGATVHRHWLLWVGAVVVGLGFLVVRASVVGDLTGTEVAPGLEGLGLIDRGIVMLPVMLQYARLLFFPLKLSADYSPDFLPADPTFTGPAWAGLGLLLLAIGVAVWSRRRAPAVAFSLGWMGATLLIVANVLAPTGVLLAERSMYLPSVGAALLAAWVCCRIAERRPALAGAVVGLAVVAGAARTVTRNPMWRSNETFFPQLVQDAPGSYRAMWVKSMLTANAGDLRRSEALLREAIRIYPLGPGVWRDLGALMHDHGRDAEAADYFWASWRLDQSRVLEAQRAVSDGIRAGAVDTAEARLREAQRAEPDDNGLTLAAAELALARGEPRRAMTLRRQVAWRFPKSATSWVLTAQAALRAHDCGELRRSTTQLRTLQPTSAELPRLEAGADSLSCTT
jgi:Tfp pilus assembly protein PilF